MKRLCLAGALAGALLLAASGCGASSNAGGARSPRARATAPGKRARAGPRAPAVASASASPTARTVSATAAGVTATLHAQSHRPRVGVPWPIRIGLTREGRPWSGSVHYEFLFGGAVVGRRSNYHFKGSFSDLIEWPAEAVGYPLTFRVVIAAGPRTFDLDYPVQVQA